MVLSQLSLSENSTKESVKAALEEKLNSVLPKGSYAIILRSYQGDFRARNTSQPAYTAMFLVEPAGKQAALAHKQELEAMGFSVSSAGEIRAN